MRLFFALIFLSAVTSYAAAPFREYPIGEEFTTNSMTVAAVYLPPIAMDMPGHENMDMEKSVEPGKEKVHLELDIHAAKGNQNGFGAGDWVPYLTVHYTLTNLDSGKSVEGLFVPMVARDGPHYGATVRMLGTGKYKLVYKIEPPTATTFGRHTDEMTGVAAWWKPFDAQWEFKFDGLPR